MHKLRPEIGFLELKEGCQRDTDRLIQHMRPLDAIVLLRKAPGALLQDSGHCQTLWAEFSVGVKPLPELQARDMEWHESWTICAGVAENPHVRHMWVIWAFSLYTPNSAFGLTVKCQGKQGGRYNKGRCIRMERRKQTEKRSLQNTALLMPTPPFSWGLLELHSHCKQLL